MIDEFNKKNQEFMQKIEKNNTLVKNLEAKLTIMN
jgi:hypothetical protein